MIKGLRAADADKPFLLYFAHHAVHGPIQATDRGHRGLRGRTTDAAGPSSAAVRYERQRELGIVGSGTALPDSDPGHALPGTR